MSCSMEFVQYVCEQLQGCGDITYRRMFGEFGFYVDGVYIGAACDNQLFIKVTDAGKKMIKDPVYGEMYPGAKPSFLIENLQDKELLEKLVLATRNALVKKKKSENHSIVLRLLLYDCIFQQSNFPFNFLLYFSFTFIFYFF